VSGKPGLELAVDGVRHAAGGRGVRPRRHDHELSASGRIVLTGAAVADRPARGGQRSERRALDRPGAPLGHRQHASAPVALLRLLGACASDYHAGSSRNVAAELLSPGRHGLAIGDPAAEEVVQEVGDRRLAGALGRLRPVYLEADQIGHQPQQSARRLHATRPEAELAHRDLGHGQPHGAGVAFERHHRALVLRRGARHRQNVARGVEHDHARVERPAGGPRHAGQAGAGLHRLGDLLERIQERSRLFGHLTGRARQLVRDRHLSDRTADPSLRRLVSAHAAGSA
jgi:hypothetical protein